MNLKNILFGMLLTIAAFPVWGSDVSVNTDGSVNLPISKISKPMTTSPSRCCRCQQRRKDMGLFRHCIRHEKQGKRGIRCRRLAVSASYVDDDRQILRIDFRCEGCLFDVHRTAGSKSRKGYCANPASMTITLIPATDVVHRTRMRAVITVPEDGMYRIAFHAISEGGSLPSRNR